MNDPTVTVSKRDREDHSSRVIVRQREQQEDYVVTSQGQDFVVYLKQGSITRRIENVLNVAMSNLRAYRAMTDEEWAALDAELDAARKRQA